MTGEVTKEPRPAQAESLGEAGDIVSLLPAGADMPLALERSEFSSDIRWALATDKGLGVSGTDGPQQIDEEAQQVQQERACEVVPPDDAGSQQTWLAAHRQAHRMAPKRDAHEHVARLAVRKAVAPPLATASVKRALGEAQPDGSDDASQLGSEFRFEWEVSRDDPQEKHMLLYEGCLELCRANWASHGLQAKPLDLRVAGKALCCVIVLKRLIHTRRATSRQESEKLGAD